jgi:hypothetical protein
MDDFLTQLTSVVTTWREVGALAGLIVLVNLLTHLTRLPLFAERVPSVARAWIAAGLGAFSGVLAALAAGKPVPFAVMSGLVIGLGAIGAHELMSNARPLAGKLVGRARKHALVITVITSLILSGALVGNAGCRAQTRKDIKAAIADCTKPEVAPVLQAATPIAEAYIDKLTAADGTVDWDTFADKAKQSGLDIGICLFQASVDAFLKRHVALRVWSEAAPPDERIRAEEARARAWPGLKIKTIEGVR